MTRAALSLLPLAALALMVSATPSLAAGGDGLAAACTKWVEAANKNAKSNVRKQTYARRAALCGCLEKRVKADGKMTDADRNTMVKVFQIMAQDRARAAKLMQSMSETGRDRVGANMNACHKSVVTK